MAVIMSKQWYQRGDASAEELQNVIDEILGQLNEPDSDVAYAARNAGLEPAELLGASAEVREGAQGAEPILTTIIVGIAVTAGSKIAETLWVEVIWPRVRRRLGARALGERTAAAGDGRS